MKFLPTCTGIVAVIKPPVTWEKLDLPGWQILSCYRAKIEHERRMTTLDSYFFAEEVSTHKSHLVQKKSQSCIFDEPNYVILYT